MDERVERGLVVRPLVAVALGPAEAVAAGVGDLGGPGAQPEVVGDEEVRLLAGHAPGPAHEAAHRLAEEQLGGRGGGVHAHPQPGMSTPSDTMRTATIHGSAEAAKRAMRVDDIGSSDTATVARTPQR